MSDNPKMLSPNCYRNKYLVFKDMRNNSNHYCLSCGCICDWNHELIKYPWISNDNWSYIVKSDHPAYWMQSSGIKMYEFDQHLMYLHPGNYYINLFQNYNGSWPNI